MKLSSKALACGQSPMRKFHPYAVAAAAAGKKIYHLNIGQPDIHTPDALYDAIHNFRTPVLAYAASPGIPELIEAIERYYRNIGVQLNESDILITTGGSEALQIAANCLLDDGDEVIVPEPFYPNYHTFITTAGGVIHPLHTKPEEGYFYADRARIEACITPKTKAIMITNPGNPTGTCLTEAQMKMLLDVAVAHDLYLVADEVYREFTYDGEPLHSFGKFDYGQENLILIDSVSKRFSACGARIGCVITRNQELYNNAMKWCQGRLCASTIDQVASAALYTVGPDYFDAVRKEYCARKDALVDGLRKIPGVVYSEPKGAFYVMAALPVDDAEKFQIWMLEEFDDNGDTLMFTPAESFYKTPHTGVNEIRMAYVINKADITRCMELLKKGIEAYSKANKD